MSVPEGFVRTSILVPEDFWAELERLAGPRKRSLFLIAAARNELRRALQRRALREATGAWEHRRARMVREEELRAVLEGDAELGGELADGIIEGQDLHVDAMAVFRLLCEPDEERRTSVQRLLGALRCVPITPEVAAQAAELRRQGLSEAEAFGRAAEAAMQ